MLLAGFLTFAFYLLLLLLSFVVISILRSYAKKKSKPPILRPPSPPALPIIGHFHLLGPSIAKSFQALAARYGPLVRLKLVSKSSIIVSNAAVAREIIKDHETGFAARPGFGCSGYNIYENYSFMFAEYGRYWRFMKKLCMTELLSVAQVRRFGDIRREETIRMLEKLVRCSDEGKGFNMGEEFLRLTNNVVCRMLMSTRCAGSDDESFSSIRRIVKEGEELVAKCGLGESFGVLGKLGCIHYGRKLKGLLFQFDDMMEKIMAEHEEKNGEKKRKDVMDLLLDISKDDNAEMKLSKMHIKAFLWVGQYLTLITLILNTI